ncbi:transcriptional regulator [Streptomyces sp. NPDC059373]
MSEHPSGSTNSAEASGQQRRLAGLLADLVPGAATFRVTLHDPATAWPRPHARAYDEDGEPLTLTRTLAITAARWIIRTHPEIAGGEVYTFDLATAQLRRAAMPTAAGRRR